MRKLSILAVLLVLVLAAFASASTLPVQGGAIQVGQDGVTCDANGVAVTGWGLETDDSTVRFVRIGDIAPECEGNNLFVRLLNGAGDELRQIMVTVPADGGEAKVNFTSPFPNVADIEGIRIWIDGPNN